LPRRYAIGLPLLGCVDVCETNVETAFFTEQDYLVAVDNVDDSAV
jgi:hypothetical protein